MVGLRSLLVASVVHYSIVHYGKVLLCSEASASATRMSVPSFRFGFEATSTAEICRLAGTSPSQLVSHFRSKMGLLEAIFEAA